MGGATEQQAPAAGGAVVGSSSTAIATATTTEASSSSGSVSGRSSPRTRERRRRSVVEDQGIYRSTCGYCKATLRSSVAHGLWAFSLTVQDYQDLLDRGWRRSGMFLYKPCMKSTCCPPYTIRLKAESFVATKNQKRVLRRMQRYLDGKLDGPQNAEELQMEKDGSFDRGKGLSRDNHLPSVSDRNASNCNSWPAVVHQAGEKDVSEMPHMTKEEEVLGTLKAEVETALLSCVECGLLPLISDIPIVSVKPIPQKVKDILKYAEDQADYTSSIAFAVTALLKRRSKQEVQGDGNLKEQKAISPELKPQEIAEMIAGNMSKSSHPCGFTVKALKGHLNFLWQASNISSSIPYTQDTRVCQAHNERNGGVGSKKQHQSSDQSTTEPASIVHQLEVRLKRSSFDAEEFALYKKYQVRVHNDPPEEVKEGSYRRFLVDSPLIFVPPANDGTVPPCGFGSFHQQYFIGGKLVAVGVVDILPRCLSSKYLFWDPDLAFLALGKYSVLQEIKWVQEAQNLCSTLQYYYLGFYIHSCPKMRYKAAYYPSELLCPERFRWVDYELCFPFLDKQSYVCLSDITCGLSITPQTSSPGNRIDQGTIVTSCLDSEEDEETAMETEADFSQVEDQEKLDWSFDVLLEKNVHRSIHDSVGPLGAIQLYVNGACLSFKQLKELALVPQWHLDTLAHKLNRYLQVVGPFLASRMAYTLP